MNFHIFFTSLVRCARRDGGTPRTLVVWYDCQRHAKILLCAGHKAIYFVGLSHRNAAPVRKMKENKHNLIFLFFDSPVFIKKWDLRLGRWIFGSSTFTTGANRIFHDLQLESSKHQQKGNDEEKIAFLPRKENNHEFVLPSQRHNGKNMKLLPCRKRSKY